MLASRYTSNAKPALVKKVRAATQHISAPLKGLDLSTALSTSDRLTATVLKNFILEEDRIRVRAGRKKIFTDADASPIETMVPFYGPGEHIAAATAGKLIDVVSQDVIGTGFTKNHWSWTAFANLSQEKTTVMVNGGDGVWSWNGGHAAAGPLINIISISKANPAVVKVATADLASFHNGDRINISGATGDWAIVNGMHSIAGVGTIAADSFQLIGVDTTAVVAAFSGTVKANQLASLVKEPVTAPAGKTWIVPNKFNVVMAHMARLWFADEQNLAIYYLPIQQKTGEVAEYPLNAIFRRGGTIRAIYTWTLDGGAGLDDQLVVFTSNGECAIFSGTDPDTADEGNFSLVGVFRFDSPISKDCVIQYGGDLYCLTSIGLMPLSALLRSESDQFAKVDKNVQTAFLEQWTLYHEMPGWALHINPNSGRLVCNMPAGAPNQYKQLVRHMPKPVWSEWDDIPGRSWAWLEPNIYLGDDLGNVYEMHPRHQSDDGLPIMVDVQVAWSLYKTSAIKHFKMVLPFIISDGLPKPYVDIKVDYDFTPPANQPDVSIGSLGADWDLSAWDESYWAGNPRVWNNWSGVGKLGRVGAPRVSAAILDCDFAIVGWDVLYETGSVFG